MCVFFWESHTWNPLLRKGLDIRQGAIYKFLVPNLRTASLCPKKHTFLMEYNKCRTNFTDTFMELSRRNIITGLEGCGKSSQVFQYLNTIATPEHPVLFGVKNYSLMREQIKNWSERYEIPLSEFNICGFSKHYEPALDAYTNPEFPFMISKGARFIFTSQALIQRNKHIDLRFELGGKPRYSHLVIDEFDFTSGVIPSLDYELTNMRDDDIKKDAVSKKLNWIEKNYSLDDKVNCLLAYKNHLSTFLLADWLENCECPLTFLSSERLAALLFRALGFTEVKIGVDSFDHDVEVLSSPYINRQFFNLMNQEVAWNHLGYSIIVTDCVNSHFENNPQTLQVQAISHSAVRGSNAYRGQDILTVLSYIPTQSIKTIYDALSCLGVEIDYTEVESLFYRDRLCQAVGRVIGYRADTKTSTQVIAHSALVDSVKEHFPYNLKEWNPESEILSSILKKAQTYTLEKKVEGIRRKAVEDYSFLTQLIELDESHILTKEEIKSQLFSSIPLTKIAKFFGMKVQDHRIKGGKIRGIKGLKTK